jgi:hypothetical protein
MKVWTCSLTVALVVLIAAVAKNLNPGKQNPKTQNSEDFIFEVQPREIGPGETAVLRWSIKGATKITIEEAPESSASRVELHKLGTFDGGSGTLEVRPAENTTYVISCEGSTTYACASLTVRVRVKKR